MEVVDAVALEARVTVADADLEPLMDTVDVVDKVTPAGRLAVGDCESELL